MENFNFKNAFNRNKSGRKEGSFIQSKFDFLWLLASQPKKTFSSEDILNEIMNSGLMIHEKQFFEIMGQNYFRKTGVQFIQKEKNKIHRYKNKFMNNDFDYL